VCSYRCATWTAGLAFFSLLTVFQRGEAQVSIGADLSFVPRLEFLGAEYRDGGTPQSALQIFSANGYQIVRLRLWHTPEEPWQGLDSTLAFAQRAANAGFDLLLDLHYSDTWADPAHQLKPAAWQSLTFSTLVDSVYHYSNAVIRRFRDAGALPRYVQIGNEITGGMLWDEGRVGGEFDTPQQWGQFGALLSAGVAGIRDSLPAEMRPQIILHIDRGGDNAACQWFFDHVLAEGVEFNVIGLSYYPWWQGTLAQLQNNLNDLAARYDKDLQIVETAYPWTLEWNDDTGNIVGEESQLLPQYPATPAGQRSFLQDLLSLAEATPNQRCKSVIYWEPAWISVAGFGSAWENLALFDFNGNGLPALDFGMAVNPRRSSYAVSELQIQAWPNPSNATAIFSLSLPHDALVSLTIYDLNGRQVRDVVQESFTAGLHTIPFDGHELPSGLYFFRLMAGTNECTEKLVLLK